MEVQRKEGPRANALKQRLVLRAETSSRATTGGIYDVLADIRTHRIWAGERQKKNTRLVEVNAPEGPASVGTEFTTVGADPMGRFTDRSVVTQADPGSVFEFVTEAHLMTKKGKMADWTNVHRYELSPTPDGCSIAYTVSVERISALPGMLAMFNSRILSGLAQKAASGVGRRGVRNLARLAEERRDASGKER